MDVVIYPVIVFTVRVYKTLERGVIWLFFPLVKRHVLKQFTDHGIRINGTASQDIQLPKTKEREFFSRIANNPSLGFGETYMEGLWDCENLDELLYHMFKTELYKKYLNPINRAVNYLLFRVCNLQTKTKSWQVGEENYNKANEIFEAFLDKSMNYSCGYWRRAKDLDEAQQHKMKLIGDKLKLEPGMKVLDIGCGWGSLCKFLAENYEVQVVGCTISSKQAEFARKTCEGLSVRIDVIDYRDVSEQFDRVVAVEMLEHVGPSNFRTFFKVCEKCLKDDGILLIHTSGTGQASVPRIDPWFHKYILPNGIVAYQTDILKNCDGLFILEDWHNFGNDYSKTQTAWRNNFVKAWPQFSERYGDNFYRMWYFYMSLAIGIYRSRKFQLWQVVLSKKGIPGGYESVR